jgi:hypothetical protein
VFGQFISAGGFTTLVGITINIYITESITAQKPIFQHSVSIIIRSPAIKGDVMSPIKIQGLKVPF